jgi:hypothetical protein
MGIFSKLFGKAEDKAPEVREDITIFTDILDRGRVYTNDVYIAGLAHHCSRKDVGFFTGVVFNEKSNRYNSRAMAVRSNQKEQIVGYVPETILDDYRKWCGKKNCVCVGYIFHDGEALRGRVRAYAPDADRDKMMKDIADYARQACEHFGWPVPTFTAE